MHCLPSRVLDSASAFSARSGVPSAIPARRRQRGFALLVTVVLVAFLVLILVGLASFTRVETQVASNSRQQARARQNALMGLNVALGQLQKHTGPDQRVTARADIVLPGSVAAAIAPPAYTLSSGDLAHRGTTGAQAIALADAHWADPAAPRNRHWTGVWQNTNDDDYEPNTASTFNAIPGAPLWLVSGNESPGILFDPNNPIDGLALGTTGMDDDLEDSVTGTRHRLLVGANSTGATAAADLQRYVTAPQVPIRVADLPGAEPGAPALIGNYAWWIGDEGVKARADLVDPYAPAPDDDPPADPEHPDNIARRQSAQRLVLEAMTVDPASSDPALAGLAPFLGDHANDPKLSSVIAPSQISCLDDDPVFRAQIARRFHDLSTSSRGVLADVKNGGLKRDLSHILSRPSLAAFRTALQTVSDGSPAFDVAPSASGNLGISTAATPYAELPDNLSLATTLLDNSATWEQLWSYYNIGNSPSATPAGVIDPVSGIAQARLPTATQQGITPMLVQGKVFYRLRVSGGTVWVDIFPMVVMANPYPVDIAGDFIVRFSLGSANPQVRVGTPANPSAPALTEFTTRLHSASDLGNAYLGNIQLVVKAGNIPAGEARIFTVDPDSPNGTTITGTTDNREIHLVNDYDPTSFITYDTARSVIAPHTHVALHSGSDMSAKAYMGSVAPENCFADIQTRISTLSAADDPSIASGFRVQPFAAVEGAGLAGGGVFFTLHDGFTNGPQQSPFLQLNYRTWIVSSYGNSSTPGGGQPLPWAIKYSILGQPDQPYDGLPLPYYAANLLPPSGPGVPVSTRWGLVSTGDFPLLTTTPSVITDDTGFENILYDLPRPSRPVTSIGQLQHFNLGGFPTPLTNADLKANQWQLNYPVGNSYATPRVARDLTFFRSPDNVTGSQYDGAFMWNDILWDRFTFSSYPASGYFDFNDPDDKLINARYRPFRSPDVVPLDDETRFRGLYEAAKNLLVEGAFNINSTSVDAWKAVLSGLRGIPIGAETSAANLTAPFPRILSPAGSADGAKEGAVENAWIGFRNLSQTELNAIAEEMVLQVRLRGPFLSMSDFVNRRLSPGRRDHTDPESPDRQRLGVSGALQSAIDRVINQKNDVASAWRVKTRAWADSGDKNPYYGDVDYRAPNRISGFPGYLLQGDVLSAIGPGLAARSDTFTIRSYGDAVNPASGEVEGRAWCEAVVQRVPDYVVAEAAGGNHAEELPAAGTTNAEFGRRYEIIRFRWLTPADL